MSDENKQAPGLWDVAKSVMAAFLGVQKSKHYERDFTHGKPWQYITIGLIGVVIFIAVIIGVVKVVMSLAGV
ncbi:DUF2970 domain-containing protein [Thiohalophilus sp.]|uniref:DUF2970 domain-containing protein n=1 Tax=Thiohalophilus sp. TaxID=3028392 RepID=UPI002ACDC80E|nr:DUF2970 domain-containing protein [Thiohalophilus sp.]MDZ7802880.1 DUF2970 domain-containing protein [Thiohalophilus sp.]